MKTNITEITNYYIEKFKSDIYKDLNTRVILNGKKAKKGNASINIYISANGKELSATIYIIERKDYTIVLFVNDNTHDVIFNNNSSNSLEKCTQYIDNYVYRCTCKMLNIPIKDDLPTKKKDK